MKRIGIRPNFRLRLGPVARTGSFHQVLAFKKYWPVIGIVTAIESVFLIPAVAAYHQAAEHWSQVNSLFDLVFATFISAWLLGWSVGLFVMSLVLMALLFGREVVRIWPGEMELFVGLPGIGLTAIYDASRMRNLRWLEAESETTNSWRSGHLEFDYGANSIAFGSKLDQGQANHLIQQIEASTLTAIRRGEAAPEDIQTPWETNEALAGPAPSKELADDADILNISSTSSIVLIAANLIPLLGTFFLGWKISDVMVLYWAESAIIGFYTVCKIILITRWVALFGVPFFIGHFGAFMAVHFLFIYVFFVEGLDQGTTSGGDLSKVVEMFALLWPALLALFLSHGYSFVQNFLGRQEYRHRTLKGLTTEPYTRVIYMQLVLIFGGWVVMLLNAPELVLIAVIGLKIYTDLRAHWKEHRAATIRPTAA